MLPGVYREEPSRSSPNPDPRCNGLWKRGTNENQTVPRGLLPTELIVGSYEYHRRCPNSQNLIAIVGDGPTRTAAATPSATSRSPAPADGPARS